MKTKPHQFYSWAGSIRRVVLGLAVCGAAFLSGRAWGEQTLYISLPNGNVDAITPEGVVSTFASGFDQPEGLAVNSTGTVFVANSGNGNISEVTPEGSVSFFANVPGNFTALGGLAFNSTGTGTLFVANQGIVGISTVTPGGVVSNLTNDDLVGYPNGLAINSTGTVFDGGFGGGINQVTPEGVASVFAPYAESFQPIGVAFNSTGTLFATSGGNIDEVSAEGVVSTFVTGLDSTQGLAFNSTGTLFVVSGGNIDEVTPAGVVSTFVTGLSGPSYLAFGPVVPVITPPKPPVITKPKIVTQPKAATAKPGATVKFTVKATGSATLTYKWERNSVALKNSTTVSGVTTATLTITKAKISNAGTYRVIVTNKGGSATSASVKLKVT